jgi:nucleoside-diphosphate-sugar epimerase
VHVVVTGASGNVGTALLRRFAHERPSWSVTGICRRRPESGERAYDRVDWVQADISRTAAEEDLLPAMAGADAVVHAAWLIQPSRDRALLERTNVHGSRRVLAAARAAGVGHVVHLSSVGAYSPGPKDRAVSESWRTDGVPSSAYSRDKAAVERMLDAVSRSAASPVVTRVRPALVFQRDAASEIARYFLGPLVPRRSLGRHRAPVLPVPPRATFQAVHADDLADALLRVIDRGAAGAFNVAGDPVITPRELAGVFSARWLPVPAPVVRTAAAATYRLHLQPTNPGWVDLALGVPVMSTRRVRDELGWRPTHDVRDTVRTLLEGMGDGAGTPSPALAPGR